MLGGIAALAIHPHDPPTLYAEAYDGVYKSTNRGETWARAGSGPSPNYGGSTWTGSQNSFLIDPVTPDILYMDLSIDKGLSKSTDGGASWSPINTGLANLFIHCLVIDPVNPDTLYGGTCEGVFKTTDGGENWNPLNPGQDYVSATTMLIDPSTPVNLYAASGFRIRKSTDGGAT